MIDCNAKSIAEIEIPVRKTGLRENPQAEVVSNSNDLKNDLPVANPSSSQRSSSINDMPQEFEISTTLESPIIGENRGNAQINFESSLEQNSDDSNRFYVTSPLRPWYKGDLKLYESPKNSPTKSAKNMSH